MGKIKPSKIKYVSYIMLQSVVYGVGNPLTKVAYESITPFWLLTFRFSIALFIFFVFFGKSVIAQLKTAKFSQYFPASLCMALAYITCNLALNWTSATNVGFLMSLPVIFTPLLGIVILRQKYDFRYLPLQIIVIIGLYLLCSNEGGFTLNKGDVFALITALALSGSLVFGKKSLESLDAITISATQAGVTAFMSIICALVFDDFNIVPNISPAAWGVIVYLALTCTCLAYVLQNSALVYLSSNTVSMLQCTQPILTAICSFIVLRETMSFRGILGGLIIIGSILVANLLETNGKSHQATKTGDKDYIGDGITATPK
ncbi:permeases of the drug/metabolite transporter (DMT) superfamily [Clostridium aceticum]|uniref:Permeases of the drug/metabolite transporter (DMT) superfamily n=1 Tax=Clostridium aceticum TaxID=84022 RepID=A0A0G3WE06_9CLOT|nr:DMT family transporter [Clostridium aceticum]AKL96080.1 permeases of the drug/metabolite transporter (DMT) superfamily [Clostridium aceticum]